jgi:hypothetical protein
MNESDLDTITTNEYYYVEDECVLFTSGRWYISSDKYLIKTIIQLEFDFTGDDDEIPF